MELRYNAFISYRHHPVDIRAATQIHRLLERFPVPRPLRKQNKRIHKLFRDKDELPLTSDLSDSITAALENSEFLIVICSVHTKESLWVQREIETFLKTHSRRQVLTVLVNGEPYDVIPEILLYDEVTDPDTGDITRIPLEPLSCDWRLPLRKARREELPRLAAALLHCSYDELRQRQKQHRMQQILTGGSLALAASLSLAAYFLYTSITIRDANVKIQENYTQALKNQSEYLTTAARQKLKDGDRFTAMALLLEALPGEGNERPYVADAEVLLAEATGVYSFQQDMKAMGMFSPEESSPVSDFLLSEDGSLIYIRDSRNIITIWDTETAQQTAAIDPKLTVKDFAGLTAEGNLLVTTSNDETYADYLLCCDSQGNLLWKIPDIRECAFYGDKEWILAIRGNQYLDFLNPETGEPCRESIPLELCVDSYELHHFALDSYPKGHPLTMRHTIPYTEGGSIMSECLYLLDTENGQFRHIRKGGFYAVSACSIQDGNVVVMLSDGAGMNNGFYSTMLTTSLDKKQVLCLNPETGEALWESEIVTYQYSYKDVLAFLPERSQILCYTGNTVQTMDAENGKILDRVETQSVIVSEPSIDADSAIFILQDGGVCGYYYKDNECLAMYYDLPDNIKKAAINHGGYLLTESSSKVTRYKVMDPTYLWEDTLDGMATSSKLYYSGDYLASGNYSNLFLYNLRSQEQLWKNDGDLLSLPAGFSPDRKALWLTGFRCTARKDLETGELAFWELPDEYDGHIIYENRAAYPLDDRICLLAEHYDKDYFLAVFHPETRDVHFYPYDDIPVESGKSVRNIMFANRDYAWVYTNRHSVSVISLADKSVRVIAENFDSQPAIAVREDGTVAMAVGHEIRLLTPAGESICTISTAQEQTGSLYWRKDMLMALTDWGSVIGYTPEGSQLGHMEVASISTRFSTSIMSSSDYFSTSDVIWDEAPDGKLILTAYGVVNILDCEQWVCCGTLNANFYHPDTDSFILFRDNSVIQGLKRYTLSELIQIAKEQLNGFQLTDEQREAYGIG